MYHLRKINNIRMFISIEAILLSLYFILAPFEDMLNFGAGTILKYVALALVGICVLRLIIGEIKIRISDPLIILPLALIGISLSSVLWSEYPDISLSRNITYILLPALFIILRIEKFNERETKLIENAIIFSGIAMFVYTLINFKDFLEGEYGRFTITEENDPNNQAALLLLPLFITIGRFLVSSGTKKIPYLLIAGMIAFCIFITGSRGALLGIIIGLSFLLFISYKGKAKFRAILSSFIFIGIAVLVINFLPDSIASRLFDEESYTTDITAYGSRSDIWEKAFTYIIPNMPFWGYGSGTAPHIMAGVYGKLTGTHNTYLNMLIEYGILGIPLFFCFLYSIYKLIMKSNKVYYIGAFVAMLIIIIFLDSYAKKYFWNTMMFYALSIQQTKKLTNITKSSSK
jgi:O-antigen ligase